MATGRRRHVRQRSSWAWELLGYGVVGVIGGLVLAVVLGLPRWQALLAGAGLLVVLGFAVALERSGLLRLSYLDEPRPPREDEPPSG